MGNIFKNIFARLNFSGNWLTMAEAALALAIYPLVQYTNAKWYVEDGLVENLQLVVCVACMLAAWCTKRDRPLFVFLGLLMLLMIFREISMGRHWLCAAYTTLEYCEWSDVPFGKVLRLVRNGFAVLVAVYFFGRKVYRPAWQYIKSAPIYVWEFCFLGIGLVLALLAEVPLDNEPLEELAETLFYLAFGNIIVRYGYEKKAKLV